MHEEISLLKEFYTAVIEYAVKYGFDFLIALVIVLVGYKLGQWVYRIVVNLCQKRKLDITLSKFLAAIAKVLMLAFAGVIALDKVGITITPLVAAISAAIFGASFAVQGTLANYASGLTIILTRPFVVGNYITVQGVSGVVEEVKLGCTVLSTLGDGVKITIPNKHIVGEIFHNSMERKVAETKVGISYEDDPDKALAVIRATLQQFSQILRDPEPQIGIQEFGDSSVNIGIRYWVPAKQYFETNYAVNLAVYKALREAHITIPFPQRDLHIVSQPNGTALPR